MKTFSLFTLTLSLIFSLTTFAGETGLSIGNELESISLRGRMLLKCPGDSVFVTCYGNVLSPSSASHFQYSEEIDADKVILKATQENGRVRTKKSRYDAQKMRSKKRFNLWIGSLLQRPLLDMGENRVDFKLLKNDTVVKEGTFYANISANREGRTCRSAIVYSNNRTDCNGSGRNYCGHYFRQENYCRN
jgi:hypothetical protein